MRLRGILAAFSAMLLLAGMFVAVHRGARGRGIVERIGAMNDQLAAADVHRKDTLKEIERLRGRARVIRAAGRLGLHLPSEEELVILDVAGLATTAGGSR